MSESKKSARTSKRIIDVAHPGKSTPSASARPVIVTNRPILKDPMISAEKSATTLLPESEPESKVSREASITPVEPSKQEDKDKTKTISQLAEEARARANSAKEVENEKEEAEEPAEQPEPDTPSEDKPKDDVPKETSEPPSSDSSTPGAEAAADEEAKEAEAAKQDEALSKLVEAKQYFLPINAVEKRRTKRFIVLGIVVSVVLAIAWVDIALDAGIIQLEGVKPLTHFFSN